MKRRTKLKREYLRLNRKYFGNRLPKDLPVFWCPDLMDEEEAVGICEAYRDKSRYCLEQIRIARQLFRMRRLAYLTLLHEMAHADTYMSGHTANHGPRFQAKMLSLAKQGAFRDVW